MVNSLPCFGKDITRTVKMKNNSFSQIVPETACYSLFDLQRLPTFIFRGVEHSWPFDTVMVLVGYKAYWGSGVSLSLSLSLSLYL